MCECGCTGMWTRYRFPGSKRSIYILSLCPACVNCDAPPGISIERYKPGDAGYEDWRGNDYVDGDLKFEKWADSEGVAIVAGMRRHEFVKALLSHLVGVSSAPDELGDDNGLIDECSADVILEEMYEDALTRPALVDAAAMAEARDAD